MKFPVPSLLITSNSQIQSRLLIVICEFQHLFAWYERHISYKGGQVTYGRLCTGITGTDGTWWSTQGFPMLVSTVHSPLDHWPGLPLFADPWITRLTSARLFLSRKYHFISFMAISSKGDPRLFSFLANWLLFYGDFRSYWYVQAALTHPTQYWISTTDFRFMDKETSFVRSGFSRQRWHIVISHKEVIPPHKSFLFYLTAKSSLDSPFARFHVFI